jgi:hypothetical protein
MELENQQIINNEIAPHIHWGHFGTIITAIVLLAGMTWVSKPELFQFDNKVAAADSDVPHYYAYEVPAEDIKPLVAGATTNPGPQIINEDGSISPIEAGQVLGASTQGVTLSLDSIEVKNIPDSKEAMQKYFDDTKGVEVSPVNNLEFETALSSANQSLINQQAIKLASVVSTLKKFPVPLSLTKLHKIKIIQYQTAIGVLQNFTQADNNPQLIGNFLQQFLKSQQDLNDEANSIVQKFNLDPLAVGGIPTTDAVTGASQGVSDAASALGN